MTTTFVANSVPFNGIALRAKYGGAIFVARAPLYLNRLFFYKNQARTLETSLPTHAARKLLSGIVVTI